jgi:hypothetical protein
MKKSNTSNFKFLIRKIMKVDVKNQSQQIFGDGESISLILFRLYLF